MNQTLNPHHDFFSQIITYVSNFIDEKLFVKRKRGKNVMKATIASILGQKYLYFLFMIYIFRLGCPLGHEQLTLYF